MLIFKIIFLIAGYLWFAMSILVNFSAHLLLVATIIIVYSIIYLFVNEFYFELLNAIIDVSNYK